MGALLEHQLRALTRPAIEQRARPVDRAVARRLALTLLALFQLSGTGSGIRPRVGSGVNA